MWIDLFGKPKNKEQSLPPEPQPKIEEHEKDSRERCLICRERFNDDKIHWMIYCDHAFCYQCLMTYFFKLLQDGLIGVFCCPCCPETLHPDDFKSTVEELRSDPTSELFKYSDHDMENMNSRFERYYTRSVLKRIPGMVWCPGADCGYAVIADSWQCCSPVTCQVETCRVNFCVHCKTPWHSGVECGKNLKRIERIRRKLMVDTEHTKFELCPGCDVIICREDDDTCDEMFCPLCATTFCWACLTPLNTEDDTFHFGFSSKCLLSDDEKGLV
ncbi:E3 ubiquitin-protein ligase RNF19A [Thelohanellus kitauei]|uniref:RBR-type E3 ubiquitin transferase n=1 Tax=Thelohanellus kitauei TaxID=669202 RepID=A0A0C2JLX9_THEKT|nr:E3 ubiquitin-protein ligase RNF19A [Thelohanellus kitauei]